MLCSVLNMQQAKANHQTYMCVLWIQVLYWYCSVSILFPYHPQSHDVLIPERSIIFSKAFQFDILHIPLSIQVSHDQPLLPYEEMCLCYNPPPQSVSPAALKDFIQTWVQFFYSLTHMQTLEPRLKGFRIQGRIVTKWMEVAESGQVCLKYVVSHSGKHGVDFSSNLSWWFISSWYRFCDIVLPDRYFFKKSSVQTTKNHVAWHNMQTVSSK